MNLKQTFMILDLKLTELMLNKLLPSNISLKFLIKLSLMLMPDLLITMLNLKLLMLILLIKKISETLLLVTEILLKLILMKKPQDGKVFKHLIRI